MFVSHPRTRPTRRGAILIVVLAMLALFAVLGLSFVLYADSQAGAARNNKIAENKDSPPDPMLAAQQYLLTQLYDVGDTGDDLMNPLRGQSFARSKYGYQAAFPRFSPFVGQDIPAEPPGFTLPGVGPIDRRQVVRFTWDQANNFVVDPERFYNGTPVRQGAGAYAAPLVGTYVNKAVPYTYPDRSNFYLALMNPATGQIVTPSFHRDDLFGTLIPPGQPGANANWTNAAGKYLTLRPRPQENPNFPYPQPNADGTYTGDVSNLRFITGSQKNDSIWIDIGGPVLEWRGRKYKAVVAPLILDLNSRINLSVAGNVRLADTNPGDVGPSPTPNSYVVEHPRHTSLHGLGPWEVNPTAVFPNQPGTGPAPPDAWRGENWELYALLRQRFPQPNAIPDSTSAPPKVLYGATPQPDPMYAAPYGRIGHTAQPLGGGPLLGSLPPGYSRVDADGVTISRPPPLPPPPPAIPPDPMLLPAAGGFGPFPLFPGTRFAADQNTYVQSALRLHPSLFNPFQWQRGGATTAASASHPFGNDDAMKWLTRYTDPKGRFTNTNLYRDTAATLADPTKVKVTGVPVNLASPFVHATTTLFSSSQQWAEIPVATGPGTFVNLGPIDVNRPLADYRKTAVWLNPTSVPPNQYEPVPHSPVNVWNPNLPSPSPEPAHHARARLARQTLARDVFVRLVAVANLLSGGVYVTGDPTTGLVYNPVTGYFNPVDFATAPPVVQGLFPALRQYAQFAANVVDQVDADDISTAFVWNPVNPVYPVVYAGTATPVVDPATGLGFVDPSADPLNFVAATLGNRVAFGTELPRLVLNEAYCSVDNDRTVTTGPAPPTSRLKRRYWIELHNPLPADVAASPLSDGGAARLQYQAGVTPVQAPAAPATVVPYAGTTYNPYRIEIAVPTAGGGPAAPYTAYMTNPANAAVATPALNTAALTGTLELMAQLGGGSAARNLAYSTTSPSVPLNATMTAAPDELNVVRPANGSAGAVPPPATSGTNVGYYVIGPLDQHPAGTFANTMSLADPPPGVPTAAAPVNALTFDVTPGAPSPTDPTTQAGKASVILLRRLANPYLPPNDPNEAATYNAALAPNQYLTIDYLENVPTRDRARFVTGSATARPQSSEPSVGRKHPYVAFPTYGTGIPNPAPPPAFLDGVQNQTGSGAGPVGNTFFTANNPLDNVAAGLSWLVHLDRQLINSLELLHVSTVSPTMLTQKFYSERVDATNNPFAPRVLEYQRHTTWGPNAGTAAEPLVPALRFGGFYRALDLLVCGNPLPGIPVGGREPGRINPNTIADARVLNAVFDPQPGNAFIAGAYAANPTLISNYAVGGPQPVWTALNAAIPDADVARTPNGVPRATIAESGAITGDRPFRSFAGSPDVQDSLLRTNRQVSVPAVPGSPILFNAVATHPHVQAEPLRKMLNSLTPTSDSFLVVMTVGFFEVTNAGPHGVTNQPVLGKELFDRVPGDLRAQFSAVVDRSQLAVEHDGTTGAISADVASTRFPLQAKLLRDVPAGANKIVIEAGVHPLTGDPGTLFDNGAPFTLAPGRLLRIGNADVNTTLSGGVVSGDGEWVRIAAVTQLLGPDATGAVPPGPAPPSLPVPGHYVITLDPTFTMLGGPPWTAGVVNRYHAAGTKVTTTVMGNPGPQTGISLEQLRQRGLVPYFSRIEP